MSPQPVPARPPSILLLVAVTAAGPLALNIFVPSMPGLAAAFGASPAMIQLTLTLYLIGVAVGQLVYGPLSDRFGRRPLLLGGLAIFALASLLCALATSIGWLILGRVAQALGGCAGMVLSRAIVRDVYGREKSASVLAYVTMAMAVAPMIAPALGSRLDIWFGWRASFVLLVAVGAALVAWGLVGLRETNHERQPIPGLRGMLAGFAQLLRDRAFLGFALNTSFTTAVFFSFLAGAPFAMTELLNEPPSTYGNLFILISLGYMAGNFLAGRLSVQVGAERMILAGSALALAAIAAAAAWIGVLGLSAVALFLPMSVAAIGNGMSMPNAIAAAISVNPRAAGAASGLLGCLQMTIGAVGTVVVGMLLGDSALPLVAIMAAWSALSLLAYFAALRVRSRRGLSTSA